MNVKELTVNVSQKINCGNYESRGVGLGATIELSESDDLLKVKQALTDKLNRLLDFEVQRIKGASQTAFLQAKSLGKKGASP